MSSRRGQKDPKRIIWSATPTPFRETGELDRRSIERLVEQHRRLGVTGLFVGGTCGEGGFMPDRQRVQLVRLIKRLAGESLHVAAHVSDTSALRVTENIRRMEDAGADSVVIAPPYMVAELFNRDFLRRYFFEPLESAGIPAGIYVRRPPAGMPLDLQLWTEFVSHPRVKFLKDSSALPEYRRHFISIRKNRPRLKLLTGAEFEVIPAVQDGYDGCLMGTGILNAGFIGRALRAVDAGSQAEALAWQQRSNDFLHDLFRKDISAWMAGLKYALRKAGLFTTEYSHLSFPLDDEDRRRIDAALEREKEFILP